MASAHRRRPFPDRFPKNLETRQRSVLFPSVLNRPFCPLHSFRKQVHSPGPTLGLFLVAPSHWRRISQIHVWRLVFYTSVSEPRYTFWLFFPFIVLDGPIAGDERDQFAGARRTFPSPWFQAMNRSDSVAIPCRNCLSFASTSSYDYSCSLVPLCIFCHLAIGMGAKII